MNDPMQVCKPYTLAALFCPNADNADKVHNMDRSREVLVPSIALNELLHRILDAPMGLQEIADVGAPLL